MWYGTPPCSAWYRQFKFFLYYIVTCGSDYRQSLDWRLDLLTPLTQDLWLHLIIAPLLISTLYRSLQHTLSPFSLLCLHWSFPGNGFWHWRFLIFHSHFFADSLTPLQLSVTPAVLLVTSRHGPQENSIHCCTPVISVGTCLFAKALFGNGCIYLLIKNLLPSSGCCFSVCFQVITW
jgi:hypothetical protein